MRTQCRLFNELYEALFMSQDAVLSPLNYCMLGALFKRKRERNLTFHVTVVIMAFKIGNCKLGGM